MAKQARKEATNASAIGQQGMFDCRCGVLERHRPEQKLLVEWHYPAFLVELEGQGLTSPSGITP